MRALRFPDTWGFDRNDNPGVMFRCHSEQDADVASWIQTHCRVYLGYSRNVQQPAFSANWGRCPEQPQSNEGNQRCVGTNEHGQFVLMNPISNGDDHVAGPGDSLGIAFVCEAQDQQRALAVQESVSLVLAFANFGVMDAANDTESWPGCNDGRPLEAGEFANCAETDGTGRFATLPLLRHWAQGYLGFRGNPRYSIAIALKALGLEEREP